MLPDRSLFHPDLPFVHAPWGRRLSPTISPEPIRTLSLWPVCVFCQIVAGEIPAHVVLDEGLMLGFLDIRPLFPGHTLLVPKEHHETLLDLPEESVELFFGTARRLVRAVESAAGADGSLMVINNKVSQSVPHLHLHIVPRKFRDGLRGFLWPRRPYPDEASAAAVAAGIRAELERQR
jgi:histidine triad (HIT) family protein